MACSCSFTQPLQRASQRGRPFTKHCYLFSVMSISLTLVRNVLFGSAPLNEGILKEDNHMPILPIMTCPKHVLELILLLISRCWKTMTTRSNLTSYNPKPTSPNYYKQCTVAPGGHVFVLFELKK